MSPRNHKRGERSHSAAYGLTRTSEELPQHGSASYRSAPTTQWPNQGNPRRGKKESARVSRRKSSKMEAEQQTLEHRVNFATIELKLAEEYRAQLSTPAPSVAMQLQNALVDGFRSAFQSLLALVLFLAESGPTLLLWLIVLSFPVWLLWRRLSPLPRDGFILGGLRLHNSPPQILWLLPNRFHGLEMIAFTRNPQ